MPNISINKISSRVLCIKLSIEILMYFLREEAVVNKLSPAEVSAVLLEVETTVVGRKPGHQRQAVVGALWKNELLFKTLATKGTKRVNTCFHLSNWRHVIFFVQFFPLFGLGLVWIFRIRVSFMVRYLITIARKCCLKGTDWKLVQPELQAWLYSLNYRLVTPVIHIIMYYNVLRV